MRYRVTGLKLIRKQFQQILQQNQAPLLICPNHLTYIDSIVLVMIFGTYWDYILNFKTMPWNFPKTTHVRKNFVFKLLGFLSKCIFIEIDQPKKNDEPPLGLAQYLLSTGEAVMLFPEGHRSTSGTVDTANFAYGVGKIIKDLPQIKVLCVYLRGKKQQSASKYPAKADHFYCSLNLLDPQQLSHQEEINASSLPHCPNKNTSELRHIRFIAKNVVSHLKSMEDNYLKQIMLKPPKLSKC